MLGLFLDFTRLHWRLCNFAILQIIVIASDAPLTYISDLLLLGSSVVKGLNWLSIFGWKSIACQRFWIQIQIICSINVVLKVIISFWIQHIGRSRMHSTLRPCFSYTLTFPFPRWLDFRLRQSMCHLIQSIIVYRIQISNISTWWRTFAWMKVNELLLWFWFCICI